MLFYGCSDEEELSPKTVETSRIPENSIQDQLAKRMAEGFHNASKYKEVRTLLKNEVMKKFDGDYNILAVELFK